MKKKTTWTVKKTKAKRFFFDAETHHARYGTENPRFHFFASSAVIAAREFFQCHCGRDVIQHTHTEESVSDWSAAIAGVTSLETQTHTGERL